MSSRRDRHAEELNTQVRAIGWPAPRELRADPLPSWPEGVLPPWADTFAAEHARAMRAPRAMLDAWILAAVSTLGGGRILVQPWSRWVEPGVLYVAVVAPPGAMKSPTIAAALAPIHAIERRRREIAAPIVAAAVAKREIAEKRLANIKKAAAGLNVTNEERAELEREATEQQGELAKPPPIMPRLVVADATPEALASLLASHGERLAMLSGETSLFGHAAGRYSDDPAIEVLLSGHARERVTVDRIGRPSLVLDGPTLTVGVGCQPAVIAKAREHDGRGLLARFLWITPDHAIGWREAGAPDPIDPRVIDAYEAGLRDVERVCFDLEHAKTLHLDEDAVDAFADFRRELELQRREGGTLAELEGWAAKADGLVLRVAGLLHVAWGHGVDREIDGETVARAFAIVTAGIGHARRALLDPAEEPRLLTLARRLCRWIGEAGADEPRERFTTRDAMTALRHLRVDRREAETVIDVLVRHELVRPLAPVEGQRSDTSWWAAHPHLVGGARA